MYSVLRACESLTPLSFRLNLYWASGGCAAIVEWERGHYGGWGWRLMGGENDARSKKKKKKREDV